MASRLPARRASRALALLLAACLCGCGGSAPADTRPLVAVSVLPYRHLVQALAGDRVRVLVMVPPGASPATHEPTLAEVRALSQAALYVRVGHPAFPFERTWLEPLLAEAGDLTVVGGGEGAGGDPHVWLSPRHFAALAVPLAAALAALLPEARVELEAALGDFQARVEALDAEIRETLAPFRGRAFLVQHPSFGHFARDYGLEQMAVEHDRREPDAFELEQLLERARAARVGTLFVQPQFDARAAGVVARELGLEVVELDPLAPDWEANLRRVAARLAEALGRG